MTIDVLLLCAIKDEYDQVLRVRDGLIEPGWIETTGPRGWIVSDGLFSTPSGPPLRIRTTWATHMGREQAQALASMLIAEQPARCLAMSGICAGRRGKVALGDVIFADRLWSYDVGKTTVEDGQTKFEGDAFQFHPSLNWVQRMQRLTTAKDAEWLAKRPTLPLEHQEDWVLLRLVNGNTPLQHSDFKTACPDWSDVLRRLWKRRWVDESLELTELGRKHANQLQLLHPDGLPAPPGFQHHVAPIATGASVTEDEGIFPRLSSSMRKVLGVEMEASALGALGNILGIPVVVAKAASDFGDAFKDDRYRQFAARAAAECLIALLRDAADLIPGRERTKTTADGLSPKELPLELIEVFAEEYPDVGDARSLWERAGGKKSEVEQISRPRDLWQRLWIRSTQGASVRPGTLLKAALVDLPNNAVLLRYLAIYD